MRRQIGSIQELGKNHYKITVTAGVNPETGRQKRITKNIRGSRNDAEKALIALAVNAGKGDLVRSRLTLDSFWSDIYLPNAESRLRPRTVAGYVQNYESLVKGHIGGFTLDQITPPVIESWLSGFESNRRKYDALRFLRMILRRAVRLKLLSTDPTDSVDKPKYKKYDPITLDAEQAARYIAESRDKNIEPLILIAIGGGLRREEFAPLCWKDISSDGDITINKAMTSFNGKVYEDETKTAFSERVVRLPVSITERLNEIRQDDNAPLLLNQFGNRMVPDDISKAYKRWVDKLSDDLPKIPLKDLRHTSLTLTLEGGADLLAVSRRAGHSTTAITAAYYLRPHKHVDEAAADGLDNMLNGG